MPDNKDAGSPATGDPDASAATDDKSKSKAPATGAGTAPATGDSSTDSNTPPASGLPTPEEWAATQASIQKMEKALKEANKESEKRRMAADEAAKAKMTDDEQKDARIAELEAKEEEWKVAMAEAAIEREVTRLTPSLNIVDPEAVVRLLDWDSITFEDGKPGKGEVEREVKNLLAAKPYLARKDGPAPPRTTGSNATDATSGSGPKPDLTAEELKAAQDSGLSPERYATLKGVKTLRDWQATRPKATGGTN